MKLKDKYIKKLESLDINVGDIYQKDYEDFSIVAFSDKVNGDMINISITFFDNDDYEIILRREVKDLNFEKALSVINEYNKNFSGVAFYIDDNNLYCIRSSETYKGDLQEIFVNISSIIEIISTTANF